MAYKALYRTYRPQTFSDVTGQEVVVKTLQNAIINNKISHAYLFSGPRGTGKTSVARIFAKALNCNDMVDGEPCDKCTTCQEISDGINPDVIEIDAASNNGVDEIRDIREKVKFLPSGSKYKIYIIDEVHMLSGGAFNALLKTLEEPPKHVVFILATTEPQKLPATIISRCQRFEFKALTVAEISERVKLICKLEDVDITEEALNSIGESAEGGMRDALSILDQAISYGNKEITIDDINEVTGSLSFEKIISLAKAIEEKDVHVTLEIVTELIGGGKEISKIINSLLVFYRDVLLYKSVGSSGFTKYVFTKEKFQELCLNIPMSKIMYFVDVLSDIQNKVRYTTTPNVFLEIALIKMCNISVDELDIMKRVTELENKLNNLGEIDLSNSNINMASVDNEKLTLIDARVNQIVQELNRLELRKQVEKLDMLKAEVDKVSMQENNTNVRDFEAELQSLRDKIDELDLFGNKENNVDIPDEIYQRIEALEGNSNASNNNQNNNDYSTLVNKIKELENKLANQNNQEENTDLTDIYNRLNELENREVEVENNVENPTENIDLSSIYNRLNVLENNAKNAPVISNNNVDLSEVYSRLSALENEEKTYENMDKTVVDLSQIYNRINALETSVRNEINELKVAPNPNKDVDLTDVYNRLDELENNSNNTNVTTEIDNEIYNKVDKLEECYLSIMDDIDELKEKANHINQTRVYTGDNVSEDLSEISDKLMFLERKVYQIIAGELAKKTPAKKTVKKNNGQIMLFGDEILTLNNVDVSSKEKYDFEELEKTPEEIEQSKQESLLKAEEAKNNKETEDTESKEVLEDLDSEEDIEDAESEEDIEDAESEEELDIKTEEIHEEIVEETKPQEPEKEDYKEPVVVDENGITNKSALITGNYEGNNDLHNSVTSSILNEEAKPTLFDNKEVKEPVIEPAPVVEEINNEETLFDTPSEPTLFNQPVEELESQAQEPIVENNQPEPIIEQVKPVEEAKPSMFDMANDLFKTTEEVIPTPIKEEPKVESFNLFDVVAEETIPLTHEEVHEEQHGGLFEAASSIIEKPKPVEKVSNNVVFEYFDSETNEQVINKERSSLVVREKTNDKEEYALEQDIIARENAPIQEEEPQVPVHQESFAKDKFASYNIKYIEQIMHDSRSLESRNDKVRIEQLWKVMTRGARPEYLSIMETLQEGKIAVVGNKEFIIVFPNVSLCNQVMRAKFKDIAIRILYNLLGDTYNYIALPIDVWTSKSVEYKQQYQIGIKYPTLKPLDIKGLEIITSNEEYRNEQEKAINQTIKLFGKDNINFE